MAAPEDWLVCLKDRLPAYISWDQYEHNVGQLAAHQSRKVARGAPRKGKALLQGLVVCGRCAKKMATHYYRSGSQARYQCIQEMRDHGGRPCQGLSSRVLDAEVSRLALKALAPAALELSLRVSEDLERARAELEAQWRRRRERARYEAERAARQYHAVEPENRLVARTLETAWEEQLREQRRLEAEYERSCREQPRVLTEEERRSIRALAEDLPALWSARTTSVEDRKTILRQIIDRVVVTVEGETEWMEIMVYWAGGQKTYRRIRRPVRGTRQLGNYDELCARLRALKDEGLDAVQMAKRLNAEGWRRPRRGAHFTGRVVRRLLGLSGILPARRRGERSGLAPGEWWAPDLARALGCTVHAVYKRLRRGTLAGRQLDGLGRRWVISVPTDELARLREVAARRPRRSRKRRPRTDLRPPAERGMSKVSKEVQCER